MRRRTFSLLMKPLLRRERVTYPSHTPPLLQRNVLHRPSPLLTPGFSSACPRCWLSPLLDTTSVSRNWSSLAPTSTSPILRWPIAVVVFIVVVVVTDRLDEWYSLRSQMVIRSDVMVFLTVSNADPVWCGGIPYGLRCCSGLMWWYSLRSQMLIWSDVVVFLTVSDADPVWCGGIPYGLRCWSGLIWWNSLRYWSRFLGRGPFYAGIR